MNKSQAFFLWKEAGHTTNILDGLVRRLAKNAFTDSRFAHATDLAQKSRRRTTRRYAVFYHTENEVEEN